MMPNFAYFLAYKKIPFAHCLFEMEFTNPDSKIVGTGFFPDKSLSSWSPHLCIKTFQSLTQMWDSFFIIKLNKQNK